MRVLRRLHSILFLGLLFVLHILKLPLRRTLKPAEYIEKFRADGISPINRKDIDSLLDASRCICCNICSYARGYRGDYDVSVNLYRRSRDLTISLDETIIEDHIPKEFNCPYGIDIGRINRLLFKD